MNIFLAPSFVRAYKRVIQRDPQSVQKIKEKIQLFKDNFHNPSLKLHKLIGGFSETWSFSVDHDLRILFIYSEDGVIFVDVGKHEEVY